MIFFYINLKVIMAKRVILSFSKSPLLTHWQIVYLMFLISSSIRVSSCTEVLWMALKKKKQNDSREYQYMWFTQFRDIIRKYRRAPSLATGLQISLYWFNIMSVSLAWIYCFSISMALFLVSSNCWMSSFLVRIVAGSASARVTNKSFSNLSRITLNSFYCLTKLLFISSNSAFSILTTSANNQSWSPLSVTMKLMMVH